jgi:hypothetical protein
MVYEIEIIVVFPVHVEICTSLGNSSSDGCRLGLEDRSSGGVTGI